MAESQCLPGGSGCGLVAKESPLKELPQQEEKERDWSELPPEMLLLISKKLPDLPDLVRFRAVCHRWLSASSLSDPPPQLPWFVSQHWDCLDYMGPQEQYVRLYSMRSAGRIPEIELVMSHRKELKGSAHRYLLSFDCEQSSLSLLNPLTRKEISLPSLNLAWCELICIRSDPSGAGDFVAIYGALVGSARPILGSCRVGDSDWKTIEQSDVLRCCQTYYKGMFYVHDQDTRITEVIDPTTGDVMHLIPPQEYTAAQPMNVEWCFNFFVESCGDLLGISRVYDALLGYNPSNFCFEMHQLDYRNENPQWVKMKTIGDRFLFLHDSSGISYKASDFPGLKGNSIYNLGSMIQGGTARRLLGMGPLCLVMFDIERGTFKRMHCPDDVDTWFLPGIP